MLRREDRFLSDRQPRGGGHRLQRAEPQVIDDLLDEIDEAVDLDGVIGVDLFLHADVDLTVEVAAGPRRGGYGQRFRHHRHLQVVQVRQVGGRHILAQRGERHRERACVQASDNGISDINNRAHACSPCSNARQFVSVPTCFVWIRSAVRYASL